MSDPRSILKAFDPDVFSALIGEEARQTEGIELIASENYTYPEALALLGSVFTNKYSEGYPGKRYYGGQEYTDIVENLARTRACEVFRAEHANVQPLSGSPMNQAVYFGLLEPGDKILAMDLSHGGHLTHGAPVSHMGRIFNFERYKTTSSGAIDFQHLRETARKIRPKMIMCGHSSYPKNLDYQGFKEIADEVGAITFADVSHIGGLIAGNTLPNPMDFGFDLMSTTTHKTLRGPRGGMILCKQSFARAIDKSVFPGLQGGPHMNQVAAVAVTLKHAATSDFASYCHSVLSNAQKLAKTLSDLGVELITGGTENHLLVVDTIASFGLDGRRSQELLDQIQIATSKQLIPDDPLPPARASGIRLGSPAVTTRGFKGEQMQQVAEWIVAALRCSRDIESLSREVRELSKCYPVPGIQ